MKTKATLPVTFDVVNHSLNAKIESKQFNAELNDFYKQTNFTVTFEPKIEVGVKVKPIDALSLQGGVGFYPFNWKIDSKTTKKVDPSNNGDHQVLLDSVGGAYSVDNHVVTYNDFTLPKFNWALGFTFYYKTMATLDFVFVYNANAGVAPSIYEAVGNGLGSDATSVVLSIKL